MRLFDLLIHQARSHQRWENQWQGTFHEDAVRLRPFKLAVDSKYHGADLTEATKVKPYFVVVRRLN